MRQERGTLRSSMIQGQSGATFTYILRGGLPSSIHRDADSTFSEDASSDNLFTTLILVRTVYSFSAFRQDLPIPLLIPLRP